MQTMRRISVFQRWPLSSILAATLVWMPSSAAASAQQAAPQQPAQTTEAQATPVVPQLVRYAGKLPSRLGDTVEAEFRIYAAAEGGDPIWTETQQVTVAMDGSYSVLLGGVSLSGLPQTVFAGGAARWLGGPATAKGSAQKPTGGQIFQASHAAPKLGRNIRLVTLKQRWWAALDRTGV